MLKICCLIESWRSRARRFLSSWAAASAHLPEPGLPGFPPSRARSLPDRFPPPALLQGAPARSSSRPMRASGLKPRPDRARGKGALDQQHAPSPASGSPRESDAAPASEPRRARCRLQAPGAGAGGCRRRSGYPRKARRSARAMASPPRNNRGAGALAAFAMASAFRARAYRSSNVREGAWKASRRRETLWSFSPCLPHYGHDDSQEGNGMEDEGDRDPRLDKRFCPPRCAVEERPEVEPGDLHIHQQEDKGDPLAVLARRGVRAPAAPAPRLRPSHRAAGGT